MAVIAASIAILAVTALVCARSISPRPIQSNATRASWMAASSSRMASSSIAPRPAPSGIIIGLLPCYQVNGRRHYPRRGGQSLVHALQLPSGERREQPGRSGDQVEAAGADAGVAEGHHGAGS